MGLHKKQKQHEQRFNRIDNYLTDFSGELNFFVKVLEEMYNKTKDSKKVSFDDFIKSIGDKMIAEEKEDTPPPKKS